MLVIETSVRKKTTLLLCHLNLIFFTFFNSFLNNDYEIYVRFLGTSIYNQYFKSYFPFILIIVEVCQSRLVFCDQADEIITKIKAIYTNRVSALCSAPQAQDAQSQCKNDITVYINETCYNQVFCVVQVNKMLHGFDCKGNGHIEMSYECKSKGNHLPRSRTGSVEKFLNLDLKANRQFIPIIILSTLGIFFRRALNFFPLDDANY